MVESSHIQTERDYAYFKQLVLAHAVDRPPHSIRVFSLEHIKDIMD